MRLKDYPVGTKVRIGERVFCRTSTGTFWREENDVPGNCTSRPSVSLETIEQQSGTLHIVIQPPESAAIN